MTMAEVQALTGFQHYGSRRKHDRFTCSPQDAERLRDAGLVRILTDRPEPPVGAKSSASPAGQASAENKPKPSGRGGSRAKKQAETETEQEEAPAAEASSSQTPASD